MVASGVAISERQEGDSDITERQADYIQGSLSISGFDPVDENVLAVLSQEQASELLDKVETICEGGFGEIVASERPKVADTDEATEDRSGVLMWITLGVVAFVLVLMIAQA
jgi:hypothetical protein